MAARILALLALALGCFLVPTGANASVSIAALDNAALNWAEGNATGNWYAWGGTGPDYDCSGLVMVAFQHEGINLPHNTVAMVDSGKLVRVYNPARGDLAMWGPVGAPYHVEFVTIWPDTTFGAHDTGSQIGWLYWGDWLAPSAYYEVVN
jgi:hypothetical protein